MGPFPGVLDPGRSCPWAGANTFPSTASFRSYNLKYFIKSMHVRAGKNLDYLGQPICLMDTDTESQRGEMPFPGSHTW